MNPGRFPRILFVILSGDSPENLCHRFRANARYGLLLDSPDREKAR
jgi:hypothetical protein